MKSIKQFLIRALVAVLSGVFLVSGVASLYAGLHEIDEIYDAQLAQSARFISGLIDQEADEVRLDHLRRAMAAFPVALRRLSEEELEQAATSEGHFYERKLAFAVWSDKGALRVVSDGGPPFVFGEPGFAEQQRGGWSWRTFLYHAPEQGLWVMTAQRMDIRRELMLYGVLWPELLRWVMVTLAAVILALLVVHKGLTPLRRLQGLLSRRDPADLAALPQPGWPDELRPLVETLNQLFGNVEGVRSRERRFVADAAHELRTPLAGVKVHLQNASQTDSQDPRHWRGLQQAEISVDRLTRIVSQLLILSRLEPQQQLLQAKPVPLADVLAEQIGDLYLLAEAKRIGIALGGDSGSVAGVRDLLAVLFRNLIENALRYTPEGGQVLVSIADEPRQVTVTVEDSGPGIEPAQREQVLGRFYRLDKGGCEGAGLGLSIVSELVRLHQATFELGQSERLGGLKVMLRFAGTGER